MTTRGIQDNILCTAHNKLVSVLVANKDLGPSKLRPHFRFGIPAFIPDSLHGTFLLDHLLDFVNEPRLQSQEQF